MAAKQAPSKLKELKSTLRRKSIIVTMLRFFNELLLLRLERMKSNLRFATQNSKVSRKKYRRYIALSRAKVANSSHDGFEDCFQNFRSTFKFQFSVPEYRVFGTPGLTTCVPALSTSVGHQCPGIGLFGDTGVPDYRGFWDT